MDEKEEITKLQTEIQECRRLLNQEECEGISRQELKEQIESKEKRIAELKRDMSEEEDEPALPRRTERLHKPTEKMQEYQMEELNKKEKRLIGLYEQWKIKLRASRESLKRDLSESELAVMADDVEKGMKDITKLYGEIRQRVTPTTELRRKIDACEAVTKDIVTVVLERLSSINGDFDEENERRHLHQLLAHDYAHSIYGTASQSRASHPESMSVAAKRAEAAAELAAKEAQYRAMQEEIEQKEKIRLMEEQHKKELEIQRVHRQQTAQFPHSNRSSMSPHR